MAGMGRRTEEYSWAQFERDCRRIANWAGRKNFKSVYGIPRGGLVVGVKLSHLLDIPLVLNKEDITPKTLIVDDVVDSGKTAARLAAFLGGKFFVGSIFWNKNSKFKPNFFVHLKKRWVVFPWETTKTSRYDNKN
jgi:hypoxanthine phosphoribosyltransferase